MRRNIGVPDQPKNATIYGVVAIVLVGAYVTVRETSWVSNGQFHTNMELVATTLALFVGVMALTRYYSQKHKSILIIGAGFIGAASLDGYHVLVTLPFFSPYLPSDLSDLIPWSWIASRQFLAIMMCLCWVTATRSAQRATMEPEADLQTDERLVYFFTLALTLACFVFFILAPLPHAYFPTLFIHRPEELLPAFCFLAALVGFLKKGSWRHDVFEHWLILSLVIGFVGQAAIMPFSSELFDLEFNLAHLLKIASYLCVLTGLLINMRATFHQAASDKNALAREVTIRKQAEIAASQNERRLRAVFASVADGIITISQQGIVQSINIGAETLFGYRADDVVGKNVKMLMPREYAHTHDKDIANYKGTGESSVVGARRDLMGLRKDGTTFPIDLIISEMEIGGERMFTGVVRDKTVETEIERKRQHAQDALRRHRDAAVKVARELKRSNAELEQFASVAAHDLQEPLRKVQAFGDRLGSRYADGLDEKGLDYISRMQDAAARMQVLISDLLSFSRVSSNAAPFVSVDLNALIRGVLSDLEVTIEECSAIIDVADLPKIEGDPRQLRQFFQNTIGNSLKYRRVDVAPVIKITGCIVQPASTQLKTRNENPPTSMCEITISDNGIGFDDTYAEKIFGIFQRLHGRTQYDGTGIGLAICRKIAERHGGAISATGVLGQGSTFQLLLPITHTTGNAESGDSVYEIS